MQFINNLFASTTWVALFTAGSITAFSAPVQQQAAPVARRSTGNCSGAPSMGHFAHKYYINTDGDTLGNWGQGLLDNLRGQCGVITNWQASLQGSGISANFETTTFCNANNVHDAIWLASDPNNRLSIGCSFSDDGSDPNVPGTALEAGEAVAGAVGGGKE